MLPSQMIASSRQPHSYQSIKARSRPGAIACRKSFRAVAVVNKSLIEVRFSNREEYYTETGGPGKQAVCAPTGLRFLCKTRGLSMN